MPRLLKLFSQGYVTYDKVSNVLLACQFRNSMNCILKSFICFPCLNRPFTTDFNENIGETVEDLLSLVMVISFDFVNIISKGCIHLSVSF
jgi:hypothetical protein